MTGGLESPRAQEIMDRLPDESCVACKDNLLRELGEIMGLAISDEMGGPFELRLETIEDS